MEDMGGDQSADHKGMRWCRSNNKKEGWKCNFISSAWKCKNWCKGMGDPQRQYFDLTVEWNLRVADEGGKKTNKGLKHNTWVYLETYMNGPSGKGACFIQKRLQPWRQCCFEESYVVSIKDNEEFIRIWDKRGVLLKYGIRGVGYNRG